MAGACLGSLDLLPVGRRWLKLVSAHIVSDALSSLHREKTKAHNGTVSLLTVEIAREKR
ncbi:hypothetical protein TNCV_3801081, partial [Trichonephila clavipes]